MITIQIKYESGTMETGILEEVFLNLVEEMGIYDATKFSIRLIKKYHQL